ncbi:Asp-tRNA(Asn)/Glu-tRNA(Gln) amidotransferase subunit GatA [Patescibacteria group bacterium]|nr:Asp-tRNA(Asn)/Glu-tRNA(Gln) amidotransferase subunit GatA [Patescibacteria group bacterium]
MQKSQELNKLTIKQAGEKLNKKEISSVELTKACLARIKEVDDKIHACLTVCEEQALQEAKKADERRAKGERGELLGIPYLVKDNIMTKNIRTTAGSKILENYIAPYNATIIKKLKQAGAVLLGKTNLDEFGHGASTENSAFGPTHNPHDLERVAGGSSGGSAAAVATDMCIFALGTDTGGSIRCPASFCGVVGLKPSYGRCSRFGLMSMTSSTDVPGALTKTVEDAEIVFNAIKGGDEKDATVAREDIRCPKTVPPQFSSLCEENWGGTVFGHRMSQNLRIGIPKEYFGEGIDKDVLEVINKAIKKFEKLGAEIVPISLPHTKYAVPVYYIITPSEISSNLARFDGIRFGFSDGQVKDLKNIYLKNRNVFGPEAKRRIMLGTYVLSAGYYDAYYLQAQKVRTKIKQEMDKALEKVDAIITPTQPDVAFKIGEQSDDPLKMYLEDICLSAASLAGLPAISIPCGFVNNLPVGMQLIGKRFNEEMLFAVAQLIT